MPLIGPYFHFGFAPDKAWQLTTGRLWLQVVPGAALFVGGLMTLASSNRAFAALGAWLAAIGGAWFALSVPLSTLWADRGQPQLGQALGDTNRQVIERVTLLYGLGVVAVFLAAVALGRLTIVGVKDAALAEQRSDRADMSDLDPDAAPTTLEERRPNLPHRRSQGDEEPLKAQGAWPEKVPATPTDSMAPRTVGSGDVRVAGGEEGRDT